MRQVLVGGAGLLVLLAISVSGCKDKASANVDPKAAQAAAKAEQDLLARRDSLLQSRTKLEEERTALQTKIEETKKAGGDTSELETKLAELKAQESANKDELVEFLRGENDKMRDELKTLRGQAAATTGGNAEIAQLSAQLQRRDAQIADMEKKLVAVASQLGEIRADIQKQSEQCAGGTTILAAPSHKESGSRYGKRDVEPLLKQARSRMQSKGILLADLPGPTQGLEKEATNAMSDGEYGKAFLAASTFNQAVQEVKIDKTFVSNKIARLNRIVKGKKLEGDKSKQVVELFNEVGDKYNDGDFAGANKRLNQIASQI